MVVTLVEPVGLAVEKVAKMAGTLAHQVVVVVALSTQVGLVELDPLTAAHRVVGYRAVTVVMAAIPLGVLTAEPTMAAPAVAVMVAPVMLATAMLAPVAVVI